MALTADQIAFRTRIIGGSDANVILGGDEEKILRLWKIKRGEEMGEDLSDVLQVQLGSFTEEFNLRWLQKMTGRTVVSKGEEHISFEFPWMGCTLDGATTQPRAIVEAKHVSAFAKRDEVIAKYMPQLHHNMLVAERQMATLTVIYGNHLWEYYDIELDPMYADQLMDAEARFWDCVQTGTPPVAIKAEAIKINATRIVDMHGNNLWSTLAGKYLELLPKSKEFDEVEKGMKSMMEADVSEAFGYGVTIRRDKAGRMRIGESK
jgi:predicted phage-related endonuclease